MKTYEIFALDSLHEVMPSMIHIQYQPFLIRPSITGHQLETDSKQRLPEAIQEYTSKVVVQAKVSMWFAILDVHSDNSLKSILLVRS